MKHYFKLFLILSILFSYAGVCKTFAVTAEEFKAKLNFKQGKIELDGAGAHLNIPPTFRYLDPQSSKKVLVEAWGNPVESAEGQLGMIFPEEVSPLDEDGWAVVISYEDEGYVSDEGVEKIDYTKLLDEMRAGMAQANEERKKAGYPTVKIVGWAETPHYDKVSNKLYWAKELAFSDSPNNDNTLNYGIRVLGRRGVIVLNAVARMSQLPLVSERMQQVLKFVEFNPTFRYADYIPDTDKAAGYGIAGLVVGSVAAKAGFFKLLIAGVLAAKKFIILGVVALIAFIKNFFGGSKKRSSPNGSV